MSHPDLKLISHKLCPYVQRTRIVLDEKAIPHEVEFIDLGNKPRWFLDISPLGKVPVLLVNGEPIFESAVIAEYVDEITPGSLLPEDPLAKARSRSWIEFASNTLVAISGFYNAPDEPHFEESLQTLRGRFASLEAALAEGPYFYGQFFSLVDAAFGPVFRYFDVIDPHDDFGLFADMPKVRRWRIALARRPSVRKAVVADYATRLRNFIVSRKSRLSGIVATRHAA